MDVRCLNDLHGKDFGLYHGDCVDVVRQLPDASVGFSVYSPPFESIFTYSDSECDMGNNVSSEQFRQHYGYLVAELARVMRPGRLVAVHCSDIPYTKWKDGRIGIKDLSGDLIRAHEAHGFVLHSRVTIWKSPVVEMTRTKALGLLYKQLQKDSSRSRTGMPDYLLVFRAPGENAEPIEQSPEAFPVSQWQEWASPVWMTIQQTNTLNVKQAKDGPDERHVCPLQLDVIQRALLLWSNPGDIVLSPFMGIGSEGVVCIRESRKFVGVELKDSYFAVAAKNMIAAEANAPTLFHDDGRMSGRLAPLPHTLREEIAEAHGFRAVAPAPLLGDAA